MDVLVLGGPRFVGRAIVADLLDRGPNLPLCSRGAPGAHLSPAVPPRTAAAGGVMGISVPPSLAVMATVLLTAWATGRALRSAPHGPARACLSSPS